MCFSLRSSGKSPTIDFPVYDAFICLPIDVGNEALGAPLEQPLRDRLADAHGRPGHDAALSAEIHRSSFTSVRNVSR